MPSKTDILDLSGFLPYRLAVIAARISKALSTVYGERFGISIAEWRVMAHLARGQKVSVRDIQECVNLDKVRVSRAVSSLEKAGLVEKSSSPVDSRLLEISLTPEGWAVYEEIVPLARAFEADLLAALGEPEKAALDSALGKLAERLDKDFTTRQGKSGRRTLRAARTPRAGNLADQ